MGRPTAVQAGLGVDEQPAVRVLRYPSYAGCALRPVTDCTQLVFSLPSVSVLVIDRTGVGRLWQTFVPGSGVAVHFVSVVPGRMPSRILPLEVVEVVAAPGDVDRAEVSAREFGSQESVTSPTSSGRACARVDHLLVGGPDGPGSTRRPGSSPPVGHVDRDRGAGLGR